MQRRNDVVPPDRPSPSDERRRNEALLRRMLEVFREHGPETVLECFDEYFDEALEVHQTADFPGARVYRGRAALQQSLADMTDAIPDAVYEPEDPMTLGDAVVVAFRYSGTAGASGLPFERRVFWLHEFRDGRVVRMRGFSSHAEAVAAAGA